jgi:hypothetical protein
LRGDVLAEGEFAFPEIGLGETDFGHALFELEIEFVHGAALFVGGDLVEFAQVVSRGDARNELEGAAEEEFLVEVIVRDGCAVLEGNEIGHGQGGVGMAQRAGLEAACVVAVEFASADGKAVGFQEEGLDLGKGESVEPAVQLGDLIVGEVGEFGWECAFSHKLWFKVKSSRLKVFQGWSELEFFGNFLLVNVQRRANTCNQWVTAVSLGDSREVHGWEW